MNRGISLTAVGHATSLLFAITFTLCVAYHLVFPASGTFLVWLDLLPGFTWISWTSFAVGLIGSYGCGWYLALIWVPLYNFFALRGDTSIGASLKTAA